MSFIRDTFFGGAEKEAARAREAGITAGIEEQRRQFDITQEAFDPFRERGGLAGEEEAAFLGLRGTEAEQAALGRFQESPGQAFLRERQERSLLRNQAAIGGLGGGNVRTALQEQAFGIASTQLGERQDRLAALRQGGLAAVGQQAGFGGQASANISNLLGARGETRAFGIESAAAARRSGLGRIAGAFTGEGGILDRFRPQQQTPAASGGIGGAGAIIGGRFIPRG